MAKLLQASSNTCSRIIGATHYVVLLFWLAWAAWRLQQTLCEDCLAKSCEWTDECLLFEKEWALSSLLIFTHILPFALVPLTMYIVSVRSEFLEKHKANVFLLQLSLASICVAIGFEFGYHVDTMWYYREQYHINNFFFFVFLICAFALWADGFSSKRSVNVLFATLLLVSVSMYTSGATKSAMGSNVPIYVTLTVTFFFVTTRGIAMLKDWRMLWVPFFSVGVNLFFIALLKNTSKADQLTKWNYIYHIAHDLLGTEMGVAIFAFLVYDNPRHVATKRSNLCD